MREVMRIKISGRQEIEIKVKKDELDLLLKIIDLFDS